MPLQPVSIKDKTEIERYLREEPHSLAIYAFWNIIVWRGHYEISKQVINNKLCIFFRDDVGCFMALPPMGGLDVDTIEECFEFMESINENIDISRIENIETKDVGFFESKKIGGKSIRVYEKSVDYIVGSRQMADLRGDRLKHKRNLANFFKKNNLFTFRAYKEDDKKPVLELYSRWSAGRWEKNSDPVYRGMLKDSFKSLSIFLDEYDRLGETARILECEGKIAAFTSGFPITSELFCINFEFADLSLKGIAQFIFREFAKELTAYPEINIMDDSGIENIKNTKLSYGPSRIVPSYTALLGN